MKLIVVCSPYQGNILENTEKAKEYCRCVCGQGHVPFAPHLFFPEFLNETDPAERNNGIRMGIEVLKRADELWVFGENISEGMSREIEVAKEFNIPIKYIVTI